MKSAMDKLIKRQLILSVLSVFAVILLVGGLSYSLFTKEDINSEDQVIEVGNFDAALESSSGTITISDIYPKAESDLLESENLYSFTVSNTGDYTVSYEVYLSDNTEKFLQTNTNYSSYKQLSATNYQYMDYKLDKGNASNLKSFSDNKLVILSGTLNPGDKNDHTLQFWLDETAPNDIIGSILSLNINLDVTTDKKEVSSEAVLKSLGLTANEGTPDFMADAETDEGIFAIPDNYGTSYYFRGMPENNYVRFAGYMWRIIRINGDGSLRIIYDGQGYANGEFNNDDNGYIAESEFNEEYDDNAYVGYMYGELDANSYDKTHANTHDSTIKTVLDNWYQQNLQDDAQNISDTLFCNDRTMSDSYGTSLGYGDETTQYRPGDVYEQLVDPTLMCKQQHDAFTVDDTTYGNGDLDYPIGLITADEVTMAGLTTNSSGNNYLADNNYWYWTLSPYCGDSSGARVMRVGGTLNSDGVDFTRGVRPVINLTAEYALKLKGEGTLSSPYALSSGHF